MKSGMIIKNNKIINPMKLLLQILFLITIIGVSFGFYIKGDDLAKGDLIIGLSLVLLFFIIMPLFIYRRWKGINFF